MSAWVVRDKRRHPHHGARLRVQESARYPTIRDHRDRGGLYLLLVVPLPTGKKLSETPPEAEWNILLLLQA